jgi:hypothetical protein
MECFGETFASTRVKELRGLGHTLLGFGPALQIPDAVTGLDRLLYENTILDEWTANLHPRVERVDAEAAVTPAPHARTETVRAELPLIPGATRLDDH